MEKLPIYPVETFPDRPALIVPAIGEAYDLEDVSRAIAQEGYLVREDLEPEVSDRPGAQGWYVFVEGREEHLGSTLAGGKGKKKKKARAAAAATKKPPKAKPSSQPRRRKKRSSGPVKKFQAQGFNLKKMPLGVMTQLLFGQIWPEAYSVSQDFPKIAFGPGDPEWFQQMDFNPHLYMNVDTAMEMARTSLEDPSWKEMAMECEDTGEPPYIALFLYASNMYGHGPTMERQLMETFDFPPEAFQLLERYEGSERADDEAYQELWQEYLTPYFDHLSYIMDQMKPPELTGYFHFTEPPGSDEWGLVYEECIQMSEEEYRAKHPHRAGSEEEDDDEGEETEEPEGGDLDEP